VKAVSKVALYSSAVGQYNDIDAFHCHVFVIEYLTTCGRSLAGFCYFFAGQVESFASLSARRIFDLSELISTENAFSRHMNRDFSLFFNTALHLAKLFGQ